VIKKRLASSKQLLSSLTVFWLKASFTIAWGIAPGKRIRFTYWLKAIFNAIDDGFQPKELILISSWGDAPGYDGISLQPIRKSIEMTGT